MSSTYNLFCRVKYFKISQRVISLFHLCTKLVCIFAQLICFSDCRLYTQAVLMWIDCKTVQTSMEIRLPRSWQNGKAREKRRNFTRGLNQTETGRKCENCGYNSSQLFSFSDWNGLIMLFIKKIGKEEFGKERIVSDLKHQSKSIISQFLHTQNIFV